MTKAGRLPRSRSAPMMATICGTQWEGETKPLLPDEVKADPEAFRQIDEVITKELDWEAAKFSWRYYVRPKFVRKTAAAIPVATVPPTPPNPIQEKVSTVAKNM